MLEHFSNLTKLTSAGAFLALRLSFLRFTCVFSISLRSSSEIFVPFSSALTPSSSLVSKDRPEKEKNAMEEPSSWPSLDRVTFVKISPNFLWFVKCLGIGFGNGSASRLSLGRLENIGIVIRRFGAEKTKRNKSRGSRHLSD